MSLPDRTTVLVVGAGPAGLAAALSLFHHGVRDLVIVDAVSEGQNGSRAIVVHAATLEALDTIGCMDEIVAQGTQATVYTIGTRTGELVRPDMESLASHTRHPYMLILPQNVTERTLERKLASVGVVVRRPLNVVGLRRNPSDSRLTDVAFEDGRVIAATYVVGADGARSVVRTAAGIRFSDPAVPEGVAQSNPPQMLIADVTFDNADVDSSTLENTFSADKLSICFPLPSSYNASLATEGKAPIHGRLYRIGCTVPPEDGETARAPSRDYLQSLLDRFGPRRLASDPSLNPTGRPTRIDDVVWTSRFQVYASIADTCFTRLGARTGSDALSGGVVLLIGDAAHVHSPFGGQGMNLGLRDGIFLGDALSQHLRASASASASDEADAILEAFAALRRTRALEVIQLAKGYPFVVRYGTWMRWLCPIDSTTVRDWSLWVLGSIPSVRRRMAWELSGLGRR